MQISLLPELDEGTMDNVRQWLEETLAHAKLCSYNRYFPLSGKLVVYVNNQPRVLQRGEVWMDDVNNLYVGYYASAAHRLSMLDRLTVVGAVIGATGLWEEFSERYMAKASELVLAAYKGAMSGLLRTEAAVVGLAFNADRGLVAARVGDSYHLPNGEEVQIDDSWTVVLDRPELAQSM